jgi:hypothetical protein
MRRFRPVTCATRTGVLVGPTDLIGNVTQITQLQAFGYRGYYSFEPFAAEVHSLASPATEIGSSIAFVRERVGAAGHSTASTCDARFGAFAGINPFKADNINALTLRKLNGMNIPLS